MRQKDKIKTIIVSIFLNIIAIGSGHFYIGMIKKSLIFLPLLILISWIFYYISTIYEIGYIAFILYVLVLLIYLYSIYDVIKIVLKDEVITKIRKIYVVIYMILFFLIFFLILMFSPIKIYHVPASSMYPTIKKGDMITVIKKNDFIRRGSLVAFRFPQNLEMHFVKRCFGIGGDKILFQDKKMFLRPHEGDDYIKTYYPEDKIFLINGKLWVLNPYNSKIKYDKTQNTFAMTHQYNKKGGFSMKLVHTKIGIAYYYKVPINEYFMVGDNRDHSYDSRFWGTIKQENIIGEAKSIYANFSDLARSGSFLD